MTESPPKPVLLRVVGPPGSGKSLLIVALTNALRSRGFRAGSVEARTGLDGATATILTTGSGARVTLPGTLEGEALTERAAALDPGLDVLLAEGQPATDERVPAIEIVEGGSPPVTTSPERLAIVGRERLARAFAASGPADDLGLAALIEERLLAGRRDAAGRQALARATEAPIESARRLLERAPASEPPSIPRPRGWRRWLDRR